MKGSMPVPVKSNIHKIIDEKGFKKKWIAEQMGVSQSYFSQMFKEESGYLKEPPNLEYLLKLAHVLGVKADDLVSYEGE